MDIENVENMYDCSPEQQQDGNKTKKNRGRRQTEKSEAVRTTACTKNKLPAALL